MKDRKDGIANFFKKQTGEGVPTKTAEQSSKAKHVVDEKPASAKGRSVGGEKVKDVNQFDEKPKTDHGKQVHSPVSSSKLDVDVKAEKSATTTSGGKKDSPSTKLEEKDFEIGIGDDSNAPNPTTPKGAKGKDKKATASPDVAIVSPRQTRSSAKKVTAKQEDVIAPPRTRKRKHSVTKVESGEDEVQVISSPESSKRTKKSPASGSKAGHAETKVNKSEARGRKAKGATTQGGSGEEGLESTVCFILPLTLQLHAY